MTGIYERKADYVFAWQVPNLGKAAAEPPPPWLIEHMQDGLVAVNQLGGLTHSDPWGQRGCAPGDYIILTKESAIEFCPAQHFTDQYRLSGQPA